MLLFDERNLLHSSQLSTEDVVLVHARDVTPLQLQEVVQLYTNASLVVVVVSEAHLLTSLASMDVPVLYILQYTRFEMHIHRTTQNSLNFKMFGMVVEKT